MKKTTPFSVASLFFIIFAFITTITADEVVLDSEGDFLQNGGTYMLSPVPRIGNGGIYTAAIRHKDSDACSLAVVIGDPYTRGWPVTISALVKPTFISTSYQLHLSFAYMPPNICTKNSDWVIKSSNDFEGDFAAVMIGDSDNPVGSLFKIKPHTSSTEKYTYKLVACSGKDFGMCRDIGVKKDNNGFKRLVVLNKGEPLVLQFDKVKDGSFVAESRPRLSMVV